MTNSKKALITLIAIAWGIWVLPADDTDPLKVGCFMDKLVVSSQTLVLDHGLSQTIARIGDRVAASSDKRFKHYTYRIINDPTINAFSTSGGYVYLNTGLLDVIDSEDELAAVIAHEIAHTNSNHQIEFIKMVKRKERTAQIVSSLINIASAMGSAYLQVRFGNSIAGQLSAEMLAVLGPEISGQACYALTVSAIKGYGRKQELEADGKAIQYLDKAGYDPNALVTFFDKLIAIRERLIINKTPAVSNLINADPGLEARIQKLKAQLKHRQQ